MLEPELNMVDEWLEAAHYYEELVRDVLSVEPGTTGNRIRAEVLESDMALQLAVQIIARDQMWELQIDPEGRKMPRYKPSTIRKKIKLGHSPDKLVNYTQMWTGRFYLNGIYVWVDGETLEYRFEKTDDYSYFAYIPDEYIGMTEENFEWYQDALSREVTRRQKEYIEIELQNSGYADMVEGLMFAGYEFDF